MTFDDLILESAQSITKATSSLMKAATAAQSEGWTTVEDRNERLRRRGRTQQRSQMDTSGAKAG